jgi:hypothetical protein
MDRGAAAAPASTRVPLYTVLGGYVGYRFLLAINTKATEKLYSGLYRSTRYDMVSIVVPDVPSPIP